MKCIFTSHTERSKAHLHILVPALQRVKCRGTKSTKTNNSCLTIQMTTTSIVTYC